MNTIIFGRFAFQVETAIILSTVDSQEVVFKFGKKGTCLAIFVNRVTRKKRVGFLDDQLVIFLI